MGIEMIHRGILNETLKHTFHRPSRSDTFVHALIEKNVYDPDFIDHVAASVKKFMISAVYKRLSRKPPVTDEILSPPSRSPLASTGPKFGEEFKARRSRRRKNDQKDPRRQNSLVESCNKRKNDGCSSSLSFQTDGSLRTPNSSHLV